jgi:hypothetical protein
VTIRPIDRATADVDWLAEERQIRPMLMPDLMIAFRRQTVMASSPFNLFLIPCWLRPDMVPLHIVIIAYAVTFPMPSPISLAEASRTVDCRSGGDRVTRGRLLFRLSECRR